MNILFITHETSRTGAPHVILYFLEWLKSHSLKHKLYVISLDKGEISSKFEKLADGFIELEDLKANQAKGFKTLFLEKLGLIKKTNITDEWKGIIKHWDVDLIYANTIVTIPFGAQCKKVKPSSKLIAHLHELEAIIQLKLPNFSSYKDDVNHFITPAPLVTKNLIKNHFIKEQVISTIPECSKISLDSKELFNKTKEVFTIGGSGTVHWRKGSDLFIQVARIVLNNNPNASIKFIWTGNISNSERIIIQEDLRKMNLSEQVEFTGSVTNPQQYYEQMDVFLMTSREDPFPLVCIEIGMLGKPIIYFDKAIGTQDVLENAGGKKVPYLDINSMSNVVLEYFQNRDQLKLDGEKNRLAFNNFTPQLICPSYYEVCKAVLGHE